jgi:toxin ParE1/3/4
MRKFILDFHPLLSSEVQKIISFYNEKSKGLGAKFYQDLKTSYETLKSSPFYQTRYDETRCLPLNKFPYMIHFTVNEVDKIVFIHSVIGTSQDPNNWQQRQPANP